MLLFLVLVFLYCGASKGGLGSPLFAVRGGGQSSGQDKALALTRKRIISELKELSIQRLLLDVAFNTSMDECGVRLAPLSSNLLEWHFSFTGVQDSAYDGGVYHGRIRLHPEYPRKAPSISMLTPTGRWEVGKEICLSASAYHQETWDMNWNLRTLVMSLRGFILSQPREIGGILTTSDKQRELAASSRDWACPVCGIRHAELLPSAQSAQVDELQGLLPRRSSRLVLSSTRLPSLLETPDLATPSSDATTSKASKRKRRRGRQVAPPQSRDGISLVQLKLRTLVLGLLMLISVLFRRILVLSMA
jgi:ubiquitin-protein ligase